MILVPVNYPWGTKDLKYESFILKITNTVTKVEQIIYTAHNQTEYNYILKIFNCLVDNSTNLLKHSSSCVSFTNTRGEELLCYMCGFLKL